MAFPATIYVELKNSSYLTIAGAALQTKDTVINYDQNNYRDQPPVLPAVAAAAANGGLFGAADGTLPALPAVVGSGLTVTPATAVGVDADSVVSATAEIASTSSVAQDDNLTHMSPRPQMFLRDRFRWWDKASPGIARTLTGTTTTGEVDLPVGSIEGLFVGQALSGTGIAANAVIQELKLVQVTPTASLQPIFIPTIVMSLAATAGAPTDVTVTVAAGADGAPNLLGECWCDRYIGWSSGIPTRF